MNQRIPSILCIAASLLASACSSQTDRPSREELGVPNDYPVLAATWAVDHSGFPDIPNKSVSSVAKLSPSDGELTRGAEWNDKLGGYVVAFRDEARDQSIVVLIPSLERGKYDLTGIGGELHYFEREGYQYTTAIAGGRGTLEIDGSNDKGIWGRFSARACYVATPGSNCFSIYQGAFSAHSAPKQQAMDTGVPADYPALSSHYSAHAEWDLSGHADGIATFGAVRESGAYVMEFYDAAKDKRIQMTLASIAPGHYLLQSYIPAIRYTERGGYAYDTATKGGKGVVDIVGNNGRALWGTFSGRVCFTSTPNANCFDFSNGRFSALNQSQQK